MNQAASNNKFLWITWEVQIRNRSMSNGLHIPLYEILSDSVRILRFLNCIRRTIFLLFRERPSVVVGQNPSIILTILLLGLRPILGFKVVIDAHFGGVDASNGSMASQRVLNWCNRTAELVIVTNENHAQFIRGLKGNAFICPDPLPDLAKFSGLVEIIHKKVFLICSYDIDEPFQEVFKAAEILVSKGFRFSVSGNYRKAGISPLDYRHVNLLGFVTEEEFYMHLFSSELVVDLTNNEDCLVCGAYEALAAEKPLILSKKRVLLEYFTGGTVFTENQATQIAEAVQKAYSVRRQLVEDAKHWKIQARKDMQERMFSLRCLLEKLDST